MDADTQTWATGLPPNGTWQVELTVEDLIGMGLLRSNAEGWAGLFTWTFQDGSGRWQHQTDADTYWCEGSLTVVDDFVRIDYTPESEACADGREVDDIQWRLDEDGLHLHLVAITEVPFLENKAYLEAKPWQKIR